MLTPKIKHFLKVIFVVIVISGLLASYIFTGTPSPAPEPAPAANYEAGIDFTGPTGEPGVNGPSGAPSVSGPSASAPVGGSL